MIAALFAVWLLAALALGLLIGRAIRAADMAAERVRRAPLTVADEPVRARWDRSA